MKQYALIVAGGSGKRMNSKTPKQFMLLNKMPVLMHTINCFIKFDQEIEIVLVLPESQFALWKDLCRQFQFYRSHLLVAGGQERFYSVKNGLDMIDSNGLVFIHDGVRPLLSKATIGRCKSTALKKGNAVPVLSMVESLRELSPLGNKMVDRNKYVMVQTPQVFQLDAIKAAYELGFDPSFTDDTSVLERTGAPIFLVEGNRENIKITHAIDIFLAEAMIQQSDFF